MENTRGDRWFLAGFAVLIVAAGLLWLLAPLSFWQRYSSATPWALGTAAALAAAAMWRLSRSWRARKPPTQTAFVSRGNAIITTVFALLLGQTHRGLDGEAAWLALLGQIAFYLAILMGLSAIQRRYFDPPLQMPTDELIDGDPPPEYNILLVVLGCGAILLYFLLAQPLLQHLPGSAQRVIGFLVFAVAYLSAQWFGYRHLRSNRIRPPASSS